MAAPLRVLCSVGRAAISGLKRQHNLSLSVRNLLSSAYSCTDTWKKSIESKSFGDLSVSEFAVQIHEQLEKYGRVSAVDIDIFAHQFGQLEGDVEEAEFVEDILKRYNQCQESFPPCPSTSHALVRGYMSAGLANRLPPLLSDRLTYGLFPDNYTLNLLLNHFIVSKDYASAMQIAFCCSMQEDFSHPVNVLLSLQACVQFLSTVSLEDLKPPPKDESDGEDEWVKVKYIRFPYYDDHFDIKDQRFLLGKTLILLSESLAVGIPSDIRSNVKVVGLGLYHKFDQGLSFLDKILQSPDMTVSSQALDYFSDRVNQVESRDADEPEVEINMRTVDDEIRKLLPTHEEKENFVSVFGQLKERLVSSGKVVENSRIEEIVDTYVKSSIAEYEQSDIEKQSDVFQMWRENRESELENQLFELRKKDRIEEMKRQIQELQEQEELLEYFEKEEKVRLTFIEEDAEKADPRMSISKV